MLCKDDIIVEKEDDISAILCVFLCLCNVIRLFSRPKFIAQCTLHNLVFFKVIGLFHILTDVSQVQSFMGPTVCRRMVNGKMQSILI